MHNGLHFTIERHSSGSLCHVCTIGEWARRPMVRLYQVGPRSWVCVCVDCLDTMAAAIRKARYEMDMARLEKEEAELNDRHQTEVIAKRSSGRIAGVAKS